MNQTAIIRLTRFLVLMVAFLTSICASGPASDLADKADAVVVAEVQSGEQAGQTVGFVLAISRALKGDLSAGTTINVSGTVGLSTNRSLRGQYGLWFLKKAGGQWAFLPLIQGNGSLETAGYVPFPRTSSPASASLTSKPTTISDQMAIELVAALQGYSDPKQIYPIALTLSGIRRSAILSGLYSTLRASQDPQLKFIGLTGA